MKALLFAVTLATAFVCPPAAAQALSAAQAVSQAQRAAPRPVQGVFTMKVAEGENHTHGARLFSQPQSKSGQVLIVQLTPQVEAQLKTQLKGNPAFALVGKTLTVRGQAQYRSAMSFEVGASSVSTSQAVITVSDLRQLSIR